MRHFPERTAPRRVPLGRSAAIGAALALTAGALSWPTLADDLHDKQKSIQSNEQKAQQDLDGSSSAYRAAQAKVTVAKNKLHTAKWRVTKIQHSLNAALVNDAAWQKRLATSRAGLAQAQAELEAGQAAVDSARLEAQRNALQQMLHPKIEAQQLNALLGAGTFSDVTRQIEYDKLYANHQSYVINALTGAEAALVVKHDKVAAATLDVTQSAGQASAEVAKVKQLQQQAVAARNDVTKLLASSQAAAHDALDEARKDQAALDKLKSQEAAIIAKILSQSKSGSSRNGLNMGGLFLRPLNGPVTSPFGWREHPIYHYWGLHDGVDMAAPCGSAEYAVETGRVASEYYSDVWGNRLFLDLGYIDGHQYTVIYNHIARYAVRPGQVVKRGQVVAYEGTTGWSTGCHIHFTVLKDGTPVNPMNYIG